MTRLGYSDDDRKALKAAKVISKDIAQEADDQSIAAAVITLPGPAKTLTGGMGKGKGFDQDDGFFPYGARIQEIDPAAWQAVGREPSRGDLTGLLRAIKEERRSR